MLYPTINTGTEFDNLNVSLETSISRHKTYTISRDTSDNCGSKAVVISSDSLSDITEVIAKFKDAEDLLLNNYYETLNGVMRKLYIDIDNAKVATLTKYKEFIKTDENIKEFVDSITIPLFAEIERGSDTIKASNIKYTIHYSERLDDATGDILITGLHIIVLNVYMDYEQMRDFIKWFNRDTGHKLDECVYSRYRQFKLPYNTKKGKNSVMREWGECLEPSQYLICNTTEYTEASMFGYIKDDVVEVIGEPVADEDKIILSYGNVSSLLNQIIKENLFNPLFWTSTKWTFFTKLIKKLELYDLDEWAKISVEYGPDGAYSVEENMRFIESINTDLKSGIPSVLDIFKSYIPTHMIVYDATLGLLNDEFRKFIEMSYKVDDASAMVDGFKDILSNIDIKERACSKITFGEYTFDIPSGMIEYNGEQPSNYYAHILGISNINDPLYKDVDFDYVFGNILDTDIMGRIEEALRSDTRYTIGIRAFMGTGKTHYILKAMMEMKGRGFLRRFALSPNNAFNSEITKELNKMKDNRHFIGHREVKDWVKGGRKASVKNCNIVSSLESIETLFDNCGEIHELYLDEFESLMFHFNSSTMSDNRKYIIFGKFAKLVIKAKVVILLDAYLSADRVKLITDLRGESSNTLMIDIKENNYQEGVDHIIYRDGLRFNNILYDTAIDKRVVVFTNSKTETDSLLTAFVKESDIRDKVVMVLNADGPKIWNVNFNDENGVLQTREQYGSNKSDNPELKHHHRTDGERSSFYEHLEDNIKAYDIDILIYSPSLSIGNSINSTHFHSAFGRFSDLSVSSPTALQMIYRVRRTESKTIHLYFSGKSKQIGKPTARKPLSHYADRNIAVFNRIATRLTLKANEEVNVITESTYIDLRAINTREMKESRNNFQGEIYIGLTIIHNIKIIWDIELYDKNPKESKLSLRSIKDAEFAKFVATPMTWSLSKWENIDIRAIDLRRWYKNASENTEGHMKGDDKGGLIVSDEEYDMVSKVDNIVALSAMTKPDIMGNTRETRISYGVITAKQAIIMSDSGRLNSKDWWEKFIFSKSNRTIIEQIRSLNKYDYVAGFNAVDGKPSRDVLSFRGDETDEAKDAIKSNGGRDPTIGKWVKQFTTDLIRYTLKEFKVSCLYHTSILYTDYEKVIHNNTDFLLDIIALFEQIDKKIEYTKTYPKRPTEEWWYTAFSYFVGLVGIKTESIYDNGVKVSIRTTPSNLFKYDGFNKDIYKFNLLVDNLSINTTDGECGANKSADTISYSTTNSTYKYANKKRIAVVDTYERVVQTSDIPEIMEDRLFIGDAVSNTDDEGRNTYHARDAVWFEPFGITYDASIDAILADVDIDGGNIDIMIADDDLVVDDVKFDDESNAVVDDDDDIKFNEESEDESDAVSNVISNIVINKNANLIKWDGVIASVNPIRDIEVFVDPNGMINHIEWELFDSQSITPIIKRHRKPCLTFMTKCDDGIYRDSINPYVKPKKAETADVIQYEYNGNIVELYFDYTDECVQSRISSNLVGEKVKSTTRYTKKEMADLISIGYYRHYKKNALSKKDKYQVSQLTYMRDWATYDVGLDDGFLYCRGSRRRLSFY